MDIKQFLHNNAVAITMITGSGLGYVALLPHAKGTPISKLINFSTTKFDGTLTGWSQPLASTVIRQIINNMQVPAAFFNVREELVELTEAGPIWHGKMQTLTIPEAEASKVCFRFPKGAYYGVV